VTTGVTVEDFLYQSADKLRSGEYLLPDVVLPAIDQARDQLEELSFELEENPSPVGLEAMDRALFEAYGLFLDALDLLELAVEEDLPSIASEILLRTQDGVETLREVRRRAGVHNEALTEEIGVVG
jgi:hypothetical protein